jgi:hypothetical protein
LSIIKFKSHFKFSLEEFRDLVVIASVFGFIVSLGFSSPNDTFSRGDWVAYLIDTIILSFVLMLVYMICVKFISISLGYFSKIQVWYLGLLIGVIAGVLFQGRVYFLIPGPVFIKTIPNLRLKKYFHDYDFRDDSWIQFLSLACILIFALVIKPFIAFNPVFKTFIAMCISFVLFNMIPLPYSAGGKILFASKFMYLFSVGYLVTFSALLFYASFIAALFGGVIGGLLFMILFHLIKW